MADNTQNLVKSSLSGWCGFFTLLAFYFLFQNSDRPAYVNATIIVGVTFAVMFAVEAFLSWKGRFGLIASSVSRPPDARRLTLKLAGWILTLLVVSIPYWLFPEYAGEFYDPYYKALGLTWPYLVGIFLISIIWEDRKSEQEEDAYYYIGAAFFKGDPTYLKKINLKQHFLKWLVKIFFLPLMFVYLVDDLQFRATSTGVLYAYDRVYNFIFLTDAALTSIGYLFSFHLTDTHIRSTEPTILGWASALICYQPFWSVVGRYYLNYGNQWGNWIPQQPMLQTFWATVIILFLSLYMWATISFGTRFSNLTHRGILNCGAYAYLKHPAYIGKLGSYFFMYIPFAGGDFFTSVRYLIIWGLVAGVYYVRAKTEEAHLRSVSPDYEIYEREIAKKWESLWTRNTIKS